jgi:16S rRNA (cytosine967-C5)-methyltransferase
VGIKGGRPSPGERHKPPQAKRHSREQPASLSQSHDGGRAEPSGLAARDLAHRLIAGVLIHQRPLEQTLADLGSHAKFAGLDPRDRAFARALAATVLRRKGELEHVLATFLQRPLPKESAVHPILLAGAAQILCLGTPAHAAVDLGVEATRRARDGAKFANLTNAVLRRVADKGAGLLQGVNPTEVNIPVWLRERWRAAYGADTADRIGAASLTEAALDISVKSDAPGWAERLGGRVLPTGSIRCTPAGRVEDLSGYVEGAWWVQDAAAALVTRAVGNVSGKTVADLCAAPGGKTLALAAAGATVTAVDISQKRLERLSANLRRLNLDAEVVAADVLSWTPGKTFDVVIMDAPCTATGTIRRHPDILRLRRADDIHRMSELQRVLLASAAQLVGAGGVLIYSTCSLEPEEGERQVDAFLAGAPGFRRRPIAPQDLGADPSWMTAAGDLRTLPFHLPQDPAELSGLDGFYVARLERKA